MSSIKTTTRGGHLKISALALAATLGVAGCNGGSDLDWDLRPSNRFSTAEAVRGTTAARPPADARGVISYPGYQVVVAQRGDRVGDIAGRLGIDARQLAEHNALPLDTALRGGELLVLPGRVSDAAAPPSISTTPLAPLSTAPAGPEPLRHSVERGETAYTIARLYNVSPRSLAEWNGLPADMSVREGQILMIPVVQQTASIGPGPTEPLTAPLNATSPATPIAPPATTAPGTGSPTPVPPSASTPLPPASAAAPAAATAAAAAPVANLSAERTSGPRLSMPVQGRVIRAYAQGRNDGIGIGAAEGTAVNAAAAGTVAAITQDTDQVPILVIRHENNLLTVYANIEGISVARGDRVTRGQAIARVRRGDPSFLHFEVREGFESVDPMPYLQ